MRLSLLAIGIFSAITLSAQTTLPSRHISIGIGPAFHGSGDLLGFSYGAEYGKYFKKRLSWQVSFGGSIHDGYFEHFYEYPAGNRIDGSYRYTIAGVQVGYHLAYSLIRTEKSDLQLRAGGIIRYQSSSLYDGIGIYYPIVTGAQFPVMLIENTTPQRTFAAGLTPQIGYTYTTKKKICLGILAGFQTDTNGDVISQLSFSIGKRFN